MDYTTFLSLVSQDSEFVGGRGNTNAWSPHGVEQSAVVLQPQQLVGRRHVVGDGFLAVEEEGVGSPDVAGQEVVQGKHLHRPFEAKPLVLPALTEKDVDGVFLQRETT